jgi:uncharacterized protein YjbJ (UPF0337 family)
MSLEDSIKAAAKDAEGRVQAAAGALSGDEAMQAQGEAKQVQAQVMHAAGDLKDKAQQVASAVGDALHDLAGNGG